MTLRCPVCRADNTAGPLCRRCRADLSLLAAVEERREFHLAHARLALRDGHFDAAKDHLTQVDALRSGPDSKQLWASLFVLTGNFPAAMACIH